MGLPPYFFLKAICLAGNYVGVHYLRNAKIGAHSHK